MPPGLDKTNSSTKTKSLSRTLRSHPSARSTIYLIFLAFAYDNTWPVPAYYLNALQTMNDGSMNNKGISLIWWTDFDDFTVLLKVPIIKLLVLLFKHFTELCEGYYFTNKENIFSDLETSKAEALVLEQRMREAEQEREELEEAQRKAEEARRAAEAAIYLEKAERELKVILQKFR